MAAVADPPLTSPKRANIRSGTEAIWQRPWMLILVTAGAASGWMLHPELDPSGLARSFALPPLELYADGVARARGWDVFIALLSIRWMTLLLFVSVLMRKVPRPKELVASLGIYLLAALSYAVPLNIGRSFLVSSSDETSAMPALMVLLTPIVLVIATRLFTGLLMRSLSCVSKVGWLVPVLSVAIWALAGSLFDGAGLSALTIFGALVVVSLQAMLLATTARGRPQETR